ncbi:MAG TPA: RtcB family protein [Anaerolineaceae bacterium]|nr:RtcB family protein [Anaerolineaceae bacterium]
MSISLQAIRKISEYEWEIPASHRSDMRVSVRLFASRKILEEALGDLSIEQAVNAATLPGWAGPVVVMPDMHQGYGFPIGGVAASLYPTGMISPGAIGYDINCGVRLLATSIQLEEAYPLMDRLAMELDQSCPSGVGTSGGFHLSDADLDLICRLGSRWALKKGMATEQDLQRTEDDGALEAADPATISSRARERGKTQLGTLGSGNHFLEVGVVEQVFDTAAAQAMGLWQGCLIVMIHCGSRGFGHQICTDYVQEFQRAVQRYGIHLPDRELVCAPLDSLEGKRYLGAMRSAANYAFCNRQILAHQVRSVFEHIFAGIGANYHVRQVYDVAHNIGKLETHWIEGRQVKVCVHRKGATRSFGPQHPSLPPEYRDFGQPVLVPGSMGTQSWVLAGTSRSMEVSYGSCAHGAGRVLSRSQAKRMIRGERLIKELESGGITIRAGSMAGLAEEAPQAYKDVDSVVESVVGADLAHKVARLRPVVVIKG